MHLRVGADWRVFTDGINVSNFITLTGSQVPLYETWYTVSLVFDGGSTWRVYRDGALLKTGTYGVTINTSVSTQVDIGSITGANFNGRIAWATIHNRALSAPDIRWFHRDPFAMYNLDGGFAASIGNPYFYQRYLLGHGGGAS
jgi:Concanavalin A-like lectin/glucanases superfamily